MRSNYLSYLYAIFFVIVALFPRNLIMSELPDSWVLHPMICFGVCLLAVTVRNIITVALLNSRDYRSWLFGVLNYNSETNLRYSNSMVLNPEYVTGRTDTPTGLPDITLSFVFCLLFVRLVFLLNSGFYETLNLVIVDPQGVSYTRAYISSILEVLFTLSLVLGTNAIVYRMNLLFVRNPHPESHSHFWVYQSNDNTSLNLIREGATRFHTHTVYDLHRIQYSEHLPEVLGFDYRNAQNCIFLCPLNLWSQIEFDRASQRALYFESINVSTEEDNRVLERSIRQRVPRGGDFELIVSTHTHNRQILYNILFFDLFPYSVNPNTEGSEILIETQEED